MSTRPKELGVAFADAIIEAAHLTYNAPRGRNIVTACIERLQERLEEIQSKKATPEYRRARYGTTEEETFF